MFEKSIHPLRDDFIDKMYDEYLIAVEGYPTESQIMSKELEDWELKELIAEQYGGFPDEYEIR